MTHHSRSGPYKWRDCSMPSEILEELCSMNHLPQPVYTESASVMVNGVEYKLNEKDKSKKSMSERKESICLNLLHKWHTLPICGYHLVPEHVETRTLLNPEKPGDVQGKIQMWVDIFPLETDQYIPPPVDITPRNAEDYELRLIIWGVHQLKLDHVPATKKCPDIFVRAWVGAASQAQDTDLHNGVCNGEVNFNWRMIFDFQYQHVEKKIVIKESGPFTEYEERVSPYLVVQVMDIDAALPGEFLGTLTLKLNSLARGEKMAGLCTLEAMNQAKQVNLFTMRSVRAFWPLWTVDSNNLQKVMAGVIDIEMNLLPKEKAIIMPVGLGRSSPNALPEPQRACSTNSFLMQKTDICRNRIFLLSSVIALLIFLSAAAICLDMFSPLEPTDWISENPVKKRMTRRSLYLVE